MGHEENRERRDGGECPGKAAREDSGARPLACELCIGIVRKPHGVRGYVKVQSLSGEWRHFVGLKTVALYGGGGKKVFQVEDCAPGAGNILMKFRGVDSPEAAALCRGWEIRVPRGQASPLAEGQYYIADLCGCALVCGGRTVGTVRSVLDGGIHQLLELVSAEGRTFFIPFVDAHVGEVDVARRSIELKSEWLLE
ncbi:MAG: ribosome maturation factor RimM [Spirochaetia bacterium]|jgi:16S rRNA processing protein RimM|nr:ribosome maturation factor RimM [Spirochaetia bacterium]